MFEEAETPWQQNRWALIFVLDGANPPAGTQATSGDIMNRFLALPGWDTGMSTVDFFLIYLQRNSRRRKRTRLWRSWPLRWSKTCRWRSAASTFDTKTTWVLARRRSQSSFRFKSQRVLLDLLSCNCSMFQLSDPLHPICVGLTLSEMSLQVKPGSRTSTPLHTHALNFISVLCFRPLMKTGKRASWMKLPRSFIRWWSVSQPINCTFTLHFLLVRFSVCLLNISLFKKCILSFYRTTNVYIYCSDIMAVFFPKSCSFLFFVWFFSFFFTVCDCTCDAQLWRQNVVTVACVCSWVVLSVFVSTGTSTVPCFIRGHKKTFWWVNLFLNGVEQKLICISVSLLNVLLNLLQNCLAHSF